MNPLDLAFLSQIRYEERLEAAAKRRDWRTVNWFRKLPKMAQFAVLLFS